jgi:tight adherence protein C
MLSDIIFILFLLLVFIGITSAVFYAVTQFLTYSMIRNRLKAIREDLSETSERKVSGLELRAREIFYQVIELSMPKEKWESSPIRERLVRAGYQYEMQALIFLSAKTFFTFLFPLFYLIYYFISDGHSGAFTILFLCISLAAIGYYAPDFWLRYRTKKRQRQIFDSFPNALDLMRVCISAGLGLDAAIDRVGKELKIESKALAEEFHTLNLELRTGATNENALKNLATRTGVEDIRALVGMLIQTEKFGTSVAEALRVHADGLRGKRTLRAQEAAAKIPVKLTIPMILCIFPALMVVVLGPAILSIGTTMFPAMTGYVK